MKVAVALHTRGHMVRTDMGNTMTGLPHPWGIYALQQKKLASRSSLDDYSWGLEEGLDAICASPSEVTAADMRRATATAARRERSRAWRYVQVTDFLEQPEELALPQSDGRRLLETRSDLQHLSCNLKAEELILLRAVAFGFDYEMIAGVLTISPEATRARVSRARRSATEALSKPGTSKTINSVAASDLSQAPDWPKPKLTKK